MPDLTRQLVARSKFNVERELPFELRIPDFELAMQDVYDFFHDVNQNLLAKGLRRLDDLLRPAAMSGLISDLMTASLGRHARSLVETSTSTVIPTSSWTGSTRTTASHPGPRSTALK